MLETLTCFPHAFAAISLASSLYALHRRDAHKACAIKGLCARWWRI